MANKNSISLPLYEKIDRKSITRRSLDIILLLLIVSQLVYRLSRIITHKYDLVWMIAFCCESFFGFFWIIVLNFKWSPVQYKTFPENLDRREDDLPRVDMFVTTADVGLEPPILTLNTILSLLAVDYPSNKLACYVSDDGCSPLTYFSLFETLKFAKIWVPFCKKYNLQLRAPFRYFLNDPAHLSDNFKQEWKFIKDEYELLNKKLEDATKGKFPTEVMKDLMIFSNTKRENHPTIIKVLSENDGLCDTIPHLIYISREKRPKYSHHYKAGAMNVLTRVSGVMTNAPFMLNVDCDMFANNPQIILHAMCFFFGSNQETNCGFVQSPQMFYDIPSVFLNIWHETIGYGMVGVQGPLYMGTGCFHRRKVIYGLYPDDTTLANKSLNVKLTDNLSREFGKSEEFIESASEALKENVGFRKKISNSIETACQLANCTYENGTGWGTKFGWMYGSATEDVNTGLKIHSRGWKSVYNTPEVPAFLGCGLVSGPDSMVQQKRWGMGLLEVLLTKNNPIFNTLFAKLKFRMCLIYLWFHLWSIRSIPEIFYAALPAYCIITNSSFLPKVQDPTVCIPLTLYAFHILYSISDYYKYGSSIQGWWMTQKMGRVLGGAHVLAVLNVVLKLLGLSESVFEVTKKKSPSSTSSNDDPDAQKFIFDDSPFFVVGTTMVLMHLTALVTLLFRLQPLAYDGVGSGLLEVVFSLVVLLGYRTFLNGLFEKGKHGIPFSTIWKSSVFGFVFIYLGRLLSKLM